MTDYTPTTEEVRNKFWLGEYDLSKTDWISSEANFNRWLAEVKAQSWRELRGHLVDDFYNHPDTFWAEDGDGNQVEVISLSSVIELVNGKYGTGETK